MYESVAIKAVGIATQELLSSWKHPKKPPRCSLDIQEDAFAHHMCLLANWAKQISLRDDLHSRELNELHIDLAFEHSAIRTHFRNTNNATTVSIEKALDRHHNILLLGYPGAGKTTTAKYICHRLLTEDTNTFLSDIDFPILVRCRDLDRHSTIYDHIFKSLGIILNFSTPSKWEKKRVVEFKVQQTELVLATILNSRNAIIVIDGLDELPYDRFGICCRQIERMLGTVERSRVIVTSRIGAIASPFMNASTFRICPLDKNQIKSLVKSWFPNPKLAAEFLAQAKASPYRDTLDRPLNVAQLCMIFHAYREIPNPPVLIYQRIVHLHLEEWDRERQVARASRYSQFGAERKRQFLASLAYEMFRKGEGGEVTRQRLSNAFGKFHAQFGLPAEECGQIVNEIESHTGLFVASGFEQYVFSHKSIQEYLVADYISRSPSILTEFSCWQYLPDECAIAMALSAKPSQFLWLLVTGTYDELERQDTLWGLHEILEMFWLRFLSRLVIEQPTFQPDLHIALAVLYLDALCWQTDNEENVPKSVRDSVVASLSSAVEIYKLRDQIEAVIDKSLLEAPVNKNVYHLDCESVIPRSSENMVPNKIVVGSDLLQDA